MPFGTANEYNDRERQIDRFVFDRGDAMVFAAAGNSGEADPDLPVYDLGSVSAPATNKNGLCVGGSATGSSGDNAENRYVSSSIGPARVDAATPWETDPIGSKDRVQPVVMAPATDDAALAGPRDDRRRGLCIGQIGVAGAEYRNTFLAHCWQSSHQ